MIMSVLTRSCLLNDSVIFFNINKKAWVYLFSFYAYLALVPDVQADPVNSRHGVFVQDNDKISADVGFVAITQDAFDQNINSDFTMSLDALFISKRKSNLWTLYVEGSSTPNDRTVATVLADTNADAGSVVDSDGNGNLQISELHYTHQQAAYTAVTGLIDVTGFLDLSSVANDESEQFLNCQLVNNPTIEFPDYALGFAYHYESHNRQPGITMVLASSHGLADNDDVSYSQLLDVTAEDKGAFIAVETYQERKYNTVRAGLWINDANHSTFTSNEMDARNYGWYATADFKLGQAMLNVRLGQANDEVSEMEGFISTAYLWSSDFYKLGIGITLGQVSDKLQQTDTSLDDQYQFEAYSRIYLDKNWHITPSLQWIHNSGFDHSEAHYDSEVMVAAVRLNWVY
ncbi:MAG: carbohydrate porin [Gammaproteobacteria bacterium]